MAIVLDSHFCFLCSPHQIIQRDAIIIRELDGSPQGELTFSASLRYTNINISSGCRFLNNYIKTPYGIDK